MIRRPPSSPLFPSPTLFRSHVVHAYMVTDLHGRGLAAVLPADADLQVGPGSPAEPDRQLDELADALLIEHLERVVPQDAVLHVEREEPAGVVAREAEGGLREVVQIGRAHV